MSKTERAIGISGGIINGNTISNDGSGAQFDWSRTTANVTK